MFLVPLHLADNITVGNMAVGNTIGGTSTVGLNSTAVGGDFFSGAERPSGVGKAGREASQRVLVTVVDFPGRSKRWRLVLRVQGGGKTGGGRGGATVFRTRSKSEGALQSLLGCVAKFKFRALLCFVLNVVDAFQSSRYLHCMSK